MSLFVDSSAFLALLDRDDPAHAGVLEAFGTGRTDPLRTHAYIVVETLAVARRRFGAAAAARLIDEVFPAVEVVAVDAGLHDEAVRDFRRSIESAVSLVDRTSFAFMRRDGIDEAIALDVDFRTAGFTTRP